ncbi:UPF0029 domain-containing protein [Chloropicon roscoffensis]|uniref:UPF0029 domain-containing protein n=1 Tax=Chloropicon roscoffensis TaxID=1461544 RepID=A0AAX4PFS4_9CHLO
MLSRFPWRPALSELIGGRRGGVRGNPSRSPLRARAQSLHTTLSESQTYVHEAKKSRFVAVASPVSSAEEAMEFVRDLGDSQASHNCFAYKAGPAQRCSDDGEPSGSAGIPILSAIEQESLDYVVCLVIRYYGGTKLGKGGLARAYGAAARECLKAAERIQVRPKARCEATIGFDDIGAVFGMLDSRSSGEVTRCQEDRFVDEGVVVTVEVDEEVERELAGDLKRATSGRVVLRRLENNEDDGR